MSGLRTSYEFRLPRGYVDSEGRLHRVGEMRLATARDELEPLRDPRVEGPDDPRLTVLVLARVVTRLGDLEMVTPHEIEGLFAVDLAYLQDFYGVINFGNQAEFEALVAAQEATELVGSQPTPAPASAAPAAPAAGPADPDGSAEEPGERIVVESTIERAGSRPSIRTAVEELPRRAES
ncbi:hypothetical protein [Nocardioides sp.]|uniref:hypothetical protein n=1 Tax=Nocardioides sp. TaxID=35761 RepID=UPI003512AA2E